MDTPLRQLIRRRWPLLLPPLLAGAVFRAVGGFGLVAFDDPLYVTDNPLLAPGSPWSAVWTAHHADVWIPATWLALRLDAPIWGPGPGGHHLAGLAWHLLNVLLAGILARRLLGRVWPAVLAAGLFAVHPLQVEAVAWVTARKDLVAAAFSLGALLLHTGGGRRPGTLRGAGVVGLGLIALAAKPAAVVLPAWLVLADWWSAEAPDRRGAWAEACRRGAGAKIALAVAAAGVALVALRLGQGADYGDAAAAGWPLRTGQAAVCVLLWMGKFLWPSPLAVYYPPAGWTPAVPWLAAAGGGVAGLAGLALTAPARLRRPAWGLLWFLVGVAPAAGIVRGGHLLLGDRYIYLPLLGLAVIAADGLARWGAPGRPAARTWAALGVGGLVLGLAAAGAGRQADHWRDSESLWRHALDATADNGIAHQGLGLVLAEQGDLAGARAELEQAVALRPRSRTHFNLANVLVRQGETAAAERHYRQALALDPAFIEAALNLGGLLGQAGRLEEARAVLLNAEADAPASAPIQFNLALVAHLQGDRAEAVARLRRTLQLDPDHAGAARLLAELAP